MDLFSCAAKLSFAATVSLMVRSSVAAISWCGRLYIVIVSCWSVYSVICTRTWNIVTPSAALRCGSRRVSRIVPRSSCVLSASECRISRGAWIVEATAIGITVIDAQIDIASVPYNRAIEVEDFAIATILVGCEHIAKVAVPTVPIDAIVTARSTDGQQIVEIDLINQLLLYGVQTQLISHLVGQEECFRPCLCITQCVRRYREGNGGYESKNPASHNRNILIVRHV